MTSHKKTFFFFIGIVCIGGGFLAGFFFQHFIFAQVFSDKISTTTSVPTSGTAPLNLQQKGGSCGS